MKKSSVGWICQVHAASSPFETRGIYQHFSLEVNGCTGCDSLLQTPKLRSVAQRQVTGERLKGGLSGGLGLNWRHFKRLLAVESLVR